MFLPAWAAWVLVVSSSVGPWVLGWLCVRVARAEEARAAAIKAEADRWVRARDELARVLGKEAS